MSAHSYRPRGAQPRLRQFESLEDRRLLALTVITPEWSPQYPNWFYDMGRAVVSRDGTFDTRDQNTDGIADVIQNSRVVWSGTPAPVGTQLRIDDLLLFDWFSMGDTPGTADSDQVAGALATAIHDRLAEQDSGVLDLHFIGHGRGAYVNAEVLRRLAGDSLAARIGFVQMTTLDPYADGDDGILNADPGGLVDFADNYYQDTDYAEIDAEDAVHGAPLLGALNFHLNDQLAAWSGRSNQNPSLADHREVHDWYLWTIDPQTVASDSPSLVDDELPVPSAADRAMLYDSLEADLNNDEQFDDFGGGAHVGYYFSIAGGAIGNVVRARYSAFTIDLATGATPLYLGELGNGQNGDLSGLAYAPNGDLYYLSAIGAWLRRVRVRFDATNQPIVAQQSFGSTQGFQLLGEEAGLRHRPDGTLYVSAVKTISQITGSPLAFQTKFTAQGLGMFEVLQAMAFDHRGTAYAVTFDLQSGKSGKLHTIAADFSSASAPITLPHDDVISVSVIGGLLYAFRENGAYFTYNLVTQQVVNYDEIAHPALATIENVASLVTLTKPNWHNRGLRADVTGDGRVTTNDVIAVVNTILSKGTRAIDPADLLSFYYDANNDGRITTADLVIVINHILQAQVEAAPLAAVPTLDSQPTTGGLAAATPLATMPSGKPVAAGSLGPSSTPRSEALNRLVFTTAMGSSDDESVDPWAIRIL